MIMISKFNVKFYKSTCHLRVKGIRTNSSFRWVSMVKDELTDTSIKTATRGNKRIMGLRISSALQLRILIEIKELWVVAEEADCRLAIHVMPSTQTNTRSIVKSWSKREYSITRIVPMQSCIIRTRANQRRYIGSMHQGPPNSAPITKITKLPTR